MFQFPEREKERKKGRKREKRKRDVSLPDRKV